MDVQIDLTAVEGEVSVVNAHVFDIRVSLPGLTLDLSPEHAEQLFNGLRQFFDESTAQGADHDH